MEVLQKMTKPDDGAQLKKFYALQLLKQSIPGFVDKVSPLHDLIERVYERARKRTKQAVDRIFLDAMGWTEIKNYYMEQCKTNLIYQVTLAHIDPAKRLCFYTDASEIGWADRKESPTLRSPETTSREASRTITLSGWPVQRDA